MHIAKRPGRARRRPGAAGRRTWRIAAAAAAVALAATAAGCSSGGSSGGSSSNGKITLTEVDYFTTSGGNTATNWYNSQFEKEHPNVTINREVVPYANLMPKVLQEASVGDLPNIVMLDNPNVPEVAATGQLKPLNDFPGFTTSGYVPGATSECTYQGKQYCYAIGTNTIGIFYNKAMLAAAHVSPPKTWAELQSDAKALTSGHVYGFAFDATNDEQSTWQLEPFFWTEGGNLSKVDTPPFINSLQLWSNMVKDGSASKSVLSWGQDPDLTQQFLHKTAAMIEDGPWIFPELNQAGWKYNQQYGIVPIPTQTAGQTVVAPLGGETWNISTSGDSAQQNMAWEWLQGLQSPSVMQHVTNLMYYLPTKAAVVTQYLKGGPEYTVFAAETETARSRTTQYGANYPKVSQAIWTAIQSVISGTATPSSALSAAQSTISGIQQVSGS